MNSTVETLDDNKVKLSVDLAEEEIEGAIEAAFAKISKEVNLPGFRPGKVPRKVLEARFGKEFARSEALRDAIPEFYIQAVREHDVDVIAPPDFEVTEGETEGPIKFEAVVETRPVVEISGYEALEVEITNPAASDEDVASHLDDMRAGFAELSAVDRAAAESDHLTISISGTHDGEEVPGLTADDYDYVLGSGAVVPEIDENLDGASAGDEIEFGVEHPDEETEGELRFKISVKEVQESVLPELDDEFAKQASEFETLAELTADATDKIAESKRQQSAALANEAIAAAIAELVEVDIPEPMVEAEVQQRLQSLMMRLQSSGIDAEQYFQITGQTPEQLTAGMQEPALQGAKLDLALRHVAKAEGLEPNDDDITTEFEALASQIGGEVDTVREQFETMGTISELRADLAKRKAMEWIDSKVTLVDEDGNVIDRELLEEPEPEPESAQDETAEEEE